jgi:polysaccharide pyruvyl transferase WcaK-like protein
VPTAEGHPVLYLIGTCGHPNYGDEFITASWLRHYAQTMPQAEVWVDTPRPGQSSVLHGDLHPKVRFVDTLYHGCWNAPSEDPAEVVAFGDRVAGEPGLIPREATGIEDLSRVDLVHIMGGSFINAYWPRYLGLIAAAASIARRYGARTAITGATLTPPVPGSQDLLGKIFAEFDLVDTRDQESFDLLLDAVPHATKSGDDAFLDLASDLIDHQSKAKTLICIQRDLLTVPLEQVADYVVRTLQAWEADQAPVSVVECLPPDDIAIMSFLEPHLPKVEVIPFSVMWRHGFPAAPRSRWITTRFHPHLIGAAVGSWGVVLPVGGDYATTAATNLTDLGSGWTLAPDLEVTVPSSRRSMNPYDGALPQLQAAKRAIADQIVTLAKSSRQLTPEQQMSDTPQG